MNKSQKQKDIEKFLSKLPEPYKNQALSNTEKFPACYPPLRVKHLSTAILVGFSWERSPEGTDYWCDIHDEIATEEQIKSNQS